METYTKEQITDAMLYLRFDSDQIFNLLNRLEEKNGNPDKRTADDKYVHTLVSEQITTD